MTHQVLASDCVIFGMSSLFLYFSQGAATKYQSETVDIPNPDNGEAKETVEEIVML